MRRSAPTAATAHPETLAAHAGRVAPHRAGLVNMPVQRGSTILFESVADLDAAKAARFDPGTMFYGRFGTPDVFAFEAAISEIEGAFGTIAVPSGLAACVLPPLALLAPGDHLLVTDSVYEPARSSLMALVARAGVEITFFDPRIGAGIAGLLRPETRLIYLESPGSLTFEIQDIPAIVAAARTAGVLTMCDNTWATALLIQPMALGVDIVVQAATKYIVGHSDAMLGLVSCAEPHYRRLRETANALGYHVAQDEVFLAARGLRTLPVRLARHGQTALDLARWLETQPQVRSVLHPGLPSHPDHAIWKRDFKGASGLFAIVLDTTSRARAVAFVEDLRLFGLGFSWGGFESLALIGDPGHARTATSWDEQGILVRLHAGLEHPDDLKADLARALDRLTAEAPARSSARRA